MKYMKIVVLILVISLLFCSCNKFKLASSIDDLLSPVSPSGEDANVQGAMDEYCKGGYSVKIPASGEYTTSFIYYDLNSDGNDEAIAFYEPGDNLGKIDMAIIENNGEKWNVAANVEGEGTDVYSVDFADINGDGTSELLISWNVISNSSTHLLDAYSQYVDENGALTIAKITDGINYSSYKTVDMNNDGVNEIMVLVIDQTKSVTATAQLYSIKDNKRKILGETKVDGHILSYKNISVGTADGQVAVYADAIKSDGDSMVTELIYWSDRYDSIISPFYSYSSGLTSQTTRKAMVNACDINGDGDIEIPSDASSIKKIPNGIYAVEWKVYKSSVLVHSCYSIATKSDNYQVLIPDDDIKKISVQYDEQTKLMTISTKDNKTEIFSVMPVLKSHYEDNEDDYAEYTKLIDESGYVFLAKTNPNANISYTIDELKNMIKTY